MQRLQHPTSIVCIQNKKEAEWKTAHTWTGFYCCVWVKKIWAQYKWVLRLPVSADKQQHTENQRQLQPVRSAKQPPSVATLEKKVSENRFVSFGVLFQMEIICLLRRAEGWLLSVSAFRVRLKGCFYRRVQSGGLSHTKGLWKPHSLLNYQAWDKKTGMVKTFVKLKC